MSTVLARAQPSVYWSAVAIAMASLALLLSPYLIRAMFGQITDFFLGPILLVIAISANAVASRSPQTRPVAAFTTVLLALPLISYAVMFAYGMGLRIPGLFQNAAIVWPQLVFFGSTLWTTPPDQGPALPYQWTGVITIVFWAVIAIGFARITRRFTSFLVLVGLSTVIIISTYFLVKVALPLFGWRLLLDFP